LAEISDEARKGPIEDQVVTTLRMASLKFDENGIG
jgi:hypothetical protein